jgi:hypothetical protein
MSLIEVNITHNRSEYYTMSDWKSVQFPEKKLFKQCYRHYMNQPQYRHVGEKTEPVIT